MPTPKKKSKEALYIWRFFCILSLLSFFTPFVIYPNSEMTSTGLKLIFSCVQVQLIDTVIGYPFPETLLLIALLLGFVALFFTFIPEMTLISATTSGSSMICLILYRVASAKYIQIYTHYYEKYNIISWFDIQWGWYLTLFCFASSVLCAILLKANVLQTLSVHVKSSKNCVFSSQYLSKNTIKYGISFLLVIIVIGVLLHTTRNTLTGKWYAVGTEKLTSEFTFTKDGYFSNGSTGGHYSANGGTLILEWNSLYGTRSYDYEIKFSKLYIYYGNHTYIYSKNKKEQTQNKIIDIE